ncbi:hypothetical protein WMY93_001386 [Mugilogobius chulae]|uniref:Uncharacterized protein n=1 Tax=Mugilogobius chulae TaxID=88201 RepID=A0AAW0Q3N8_9GOBI
MSQKRSSCPTVHLIATFLFTFSFTQTEASILRKFESQNGRTEASDMREGVIVFGKEIQNASLEDDTSYQADFAGFSKGKVFDVSPKETLWKRMSPSLRCGMNHMKFRALGAPPKFFELDQHPPMPLSQVPSSCGYSMQEYSTGLNLKIPFHGCHIVQEDGHYQLSLLWNGIPVTLKCPKHQHQHHHHHHNHGIHHIFGITCLRLKTRKVLLIQLSGMLT